MNFTQGYEVAQHLTQLDYTVKKYNSKSVWLMVDNRKLELEQLQHKLADFGCYHDPDAKGSSIGALRTGDVKIFLKSVTADVMKSENSAIDALNKNLERIYLEESNIRIVLDNGKELVNPNKVVKTPGTPKSDFYFTSANGDTIHVSHKKGSKPNDFQQWSGVTEEAISANRYAQQFQYEMNHRYTEMSSGQSIAMRIPNDEDGIALKTMAVYGADSVTPNSPHGANKVDCLIQGTPSLAKIAHGVYKLQSTGHIHTYPDLPKDGFDPVLAMVYKGDRSNYGIRGARASIYPVNGRLFKEVFDG